MSFRAFAVARRELLPCNLRPSSTDAPAAGKRRPPYVIVLVTPQVSFTIVSTTTFGGPIWWVPRRLLLRPPISNGSHLYGPNPRIEIEIEIKLRCTNSPDSDGKLFYLRRRIKSHKRNQSKFPIMCENRPSSPAPRCCIPPQFGYFCVQIVSGFCSGSVEVTTMCQRRSPLGGIYSVWT